MNSSTAVDVVNISWHLRDMEQVTGQGCIMSHAFAVGDLVHNEYAKADGIVVALSESLIHVRVTAALGDLYKVGYEYAWLPRHLVSLDALN